MTLRFLLADDHAVFRSGLRTVFDTQRDLECVAEVGDGRAAVAETLRLRHLATALGTSITYFFSSPARSNGHVIRAEKRKTIAVPRPAEDEERAAIEAGGIRFELASPDTAETLEAIYGRYEKGASTGEEMYNHEGEEWAMVLAGRFKITLGDEVYFLDPGDSIWFKSNIPHRIDNVADGVSEYIWMNSPKSF